MPEDVVGNLAFAIGYYKHVNVRGRCVPAVITVTDDAIIAIIDEASYRIFLSEHARCPYVTHKVQRHVDEDLDDKVSEIINSIETCPRVVDQPCKIYGIM